MPQLLINDTIQKTLPVSSSLPETFKTFFIFGISLIFVFFFFCFLKAATEAGLASAGSEENAGKLRKSIQSMGGIFIALVVLVSVYSNSVGNSFLSFSFLSLSPLSSTNTSISQKPSTLTANTSSVTSSSGSSLGSTCMNAEKIKTDLQGGASICGNTSCKKTCSFSPEIKTIVNEEAKSAGVAPNIIFALMCQESSGDLAAQHRNNNGSYDCGLMQINGSSCTPEILNPRNNVHSGVLLYKMKSLAVSAYSYRSVSPENMAFASYNCCGSEGTPNARSADCNTSTGFPFDLPKWACPLNPGTSQTNMCFVRNYACEVSACLDKY